MKATCEFYPEYTAYAKVDLVGTRWTLSMLALHLSQRPIGELDPSLVDAGPYTGRFRNQEWQLWTSRMAKLPLRPVGGDDADLGGPDDGDDVLPSDFADENGDQGSDGGRSEGCADHDADREPSVASGAHSEVSHYT